MVWRLPRSYSHASREQYVNMTAAYDGGFWWKQLFYIAGIYQKSAWVALSCSDEWKAGGKYKHIVLPRSSIVTWRTMALVSLILIDANSVQNGYMCNFPLDWCALELCQTAWRSNANMFNRVIEVGVFVRRRSVFLKALSHNGYVQLSYSIDIQWSMHLCFVRPWCCRSNIRSVKNTFIRMSSASVDRSQAFIFIVHLYSLQLRFAIW